MNFCFCENCGVNFPLGQKHICYQSKPSPHRISPELAAKIAAEIVQELIEQEQISENSNEARRTGGWIAEIVEKVGNAD